MVDLRPSGDARLDEEPRLIVGDARLELCHKLRPLRPRADEGEVATDDVPELGELIEM